jgi:hypothetical protein
VQIVRNIVRKLACTWLWVIFLLVAVLLTRLVYPAPWSLTDILLVKQDVIVLAALFVGGAACALKPSLVVGLGELVGGVDIRTATWTMPGRPFAFALFLALLSGFVAWIGTWLVFDGYALTRDEDMANFGAVALAHGQLLARVPAEWRAFAHSLQSDFVTFTPGDGFWLSPYLPVYSALCAAAGLTGLRGLINPALVGISVFVIFAVARRLWPERRDIGLVAAILLATSSQVLVAGMTSYAMTAHMAFDLAWLWLFLRGGWLGHLGALVVGFLASGLHQLAFHPLFAAPFVIQLWVERKWRVATLYTVAYAVICLFWAEFGRIALATVNEAASSGGGSGALSLGFVGQTLYVLSQFGPHSYIFVDENLIRFVTWQNVLATPLAVIGFIGALRAKGTLRSLAFGVVLTTVVVYFARPEQGQGWGFRYWHGLLGSICLLAAYAWGRVTDALPSSVQRAAGGLFAVCTAVSILWLFPLRALQAHAYVHPYAAAYAAIQRAPTQVVLVDPAGAWLTIELVRNDPFLGNRPLEFDLSNLTYTQVADLCSRYTVSVFGPADAVRFGIPRLPVPYPGRPYMPVRAFARLSCGTPRTPVREIVPS